jgi:hypothetical protein
MWHVEGRKEMHTGFWYGNVNEREHLEGLRVGEKIILKWT